MRRPRAWPNWRSVCKVGDLLGVLPVHSCLTADLLKEYQTLDGERIHDGADPGILGDGAIVSDIYGRI